jgi:hypothetical protein
MAFSPFSQHGRLYAISLKYLCMELHGGFGIECGFIGAVEHLILTAGHLIVWQQFHTVNTVGFQYFAGLLQKYESDVKVQYQTVNMDVQYPVTITRAKIKNAFVSWGSLEEFINGITQSLYAGASIDQYNWTKALVSNAYRNGHTINKIITKPTDEASAKAFVKAAREYFMNFQTPTTDFNAWAKVNTDDEKAIVTWTNPEDVVFLIRNDVLAELDIEVMASAFNIDSAKLYGRIIGVKDFDMFNDEGEKVFDGSAILGLMADKNWFKIKSQDIEMDVFFNPNNRCYNYYLNVVKMYNYSLFANAVVFATEEPSD